MKSLKVIPLLIFLLTTPIAIAQQTASPAPTASPSILVEVPDDLDLEACFSDLVTADRDGSGAIEKDEYLNFIMNVFLVKSCRGDIIRAEAAAQPMTNKYK